MRTVLLSLFLTVAAFAQTAQFPGAVSTDAQLKVAGNNLSTRLRVSATAGDTILTVIDASRVTANMLLSIDNEIVSVTSVAGENITVVRGFNGTTAASHSTGRAVEARITAWHHGALAAEVKAIQTALGPNLANVSPGTALNANFYNFTPQQPGLTLIASVANQITMTPCPIGVAGANTGHTLYISGGTGTAELVTIAGGTCTSGAASGTILFTPANAHSGAYTVASATGGQRELASVYDYGFTGTGTVYNPTYTAKKMEIRDAGPAWASHTKISDTFRVSVNDYPASRQFFMNTVGMSEAIAGLVNIPANSIGNHSTGVAGYAITASPTTGAVGVYSGAHVAANNTASFAFNGVVTNCVAVYCSPSDVFSPTGHWGLELDFNIHKMADLSAPNANVRGISLIGDSQIQSLGLMTAIDIDRIGINQDVQWKKGLAFQNRATDYPIYLENGAPVSGIGVYLGTQAAAGASGSGSVRFNSRDAGAVAHYVTASTDPDGNFAFQFNTPGSGLFSITTAQALQAPAGAAAAPGIVLGSNVTSGLYASGTNEIAIATAGVQRWKISAGGEIINYAPVTFLSTTRSNPNLIASAAALTLGVGNVFSVSGTTNITSISGCGAGDDGREITIIFLGILTLTDGSNIKSAGNFVTTADDTWKAVCNSSAWYELARSVN